MSRAFSQYFPPRGPSGPDLAHVVDERAGGGDLAERELVVVLRVEHVDQVRVKRVDILTKKSVVGAMQWQGVSGTDTRSINRVERQGQNPLN